MKIVMLAMMTVTACLADDSVPEHRAFGSLNEVLNLVPVRPRQPSSVYLQAAVGRWIYVTVPIDRFERYEGKMHRLRGLTSPHWRLSWRMRSLKPRIHVCIQGPFEAAALQPSQSRTYEVLGRIGVASMEGKELYLELHYCRLNLDAQSAATHVKLQKFSAAEVARLNPPQAR